MRMPPGSYTRTKTYSSGKKYRLVISSNGRILEATPVSSKVSRTTTGKRLAKRRRRIR